ncbi:MAG: 16S rRNA (uracil(1498)-N(3))-methyltransferase [Cyclobacteriaceae bacterium]|nr:16S rRNA (uracil(1498)-N(3))-methyltransferase [Cyclobacteriaceae bacterium]
MNLFFQPAVSEGINHLTAEESYHAFRVLRMSAGDDIKITDGKGVFYQGQIISIDSKKCVFKINNYEKIPAKSFRIHIAIAPTKNADRIEWFVEKAVEIGVHEISFILSKNSERRVLNLERIEKIAISAMKQSQQAWMPMLHPLRPFSEILKQPADQRFIGHVDSSNPVHLKAMAKPNKSYLVLIGPEGDFGNEELNAALQSGFEKVSLGENRLRTETAGLATSQILQLTNI